MSLYSNQTVAAKGTFIEGKKVDIDASVFQLAIRVTPAAAVTKNVSVKVIVAANPFDLTATSPAQLPSQAASVGVTLLAGEDSVKIDQSLAALRRGEKHFAYITCSAVPGVNLAVDAEIVPVT